MKTINYIVITSIFEPTKAVKKFAQLKDYQLVVVGDKKSPENWESENVVYLHFGLGSNDKVDE